MTCTGTILVCSKCGCEQRRRYVPLDALNDARADCDFWRQRAVVEMAALLEAHPDADEAWLAAKMLLVPRRVREILPAARAYLDEALNAARER